LPRTIILWRCSSVTLSCADRAASATPAPLGPFPLPRLAQRSSWIRVPQTRVPLRVDEGKGEIFCLVEAPDAEAAITVHREAHGLVADEIYQVQEGT
jgi:hypothetical protein